MKIKTIFKTVTLLLFIGLVSCKDDDTIVNPVPPVETVDPIDPVDPVETPDFKVTTHDEGHPEITEGQIFTYTVVGEDSKLGFDIKNLTDTVSYFRITCEELINNDGTNFQFCWSICTLEVFEGTTYPSQGAISINPGETQLSTADHFQNGNTGDGINYPMDYKFRIFQTDASGTEIQGAQTLSLTYRYEQ